MVEEKKKETAVEKLYLVLKECDSSIFPPWIICPRVIHQIGVGSRKHSWIRALHTPELCWSKSGYFPTEELGWALKKKPTTCADVQLIELESKCRDVRQCPHRHPPSVKVKEGKWKSGPKESILDLALSEWHIVSDLEKISAFPTGGVKTRKGS